MTIKGRGPGKMPWRAASGPKLPTPGADFPVLNAHVGAMQAL